MRSALPAATLALLSLTVIAVAQNQPVKFEVASVKPSNPDSTARVVFSCTGGPVQLDATHFSATDKNLYTLITLAYGMSCGVAMTQDSVVGGPPWIESDQFDIAAVISQGIQQERHDPGILLWD